MRRLIAAMEPWDVASRDPRNWLPVDPKGLDSEPRGRFDRRKRALDLYLLTDRPITEMLSSAGISCSDLYRLLDRAFQAMPDGRPAGYLVCLPRFHTQPYVRTAKGGRGTAGRFAQLLLEHPAVQKGLDAEVSEQKKRGNMAAGCKPYVMPLWLAFQLLCEAEGIDTTSDYPFTNADRGREAVRRYARQLCDADFGTRARTRYGTEAARLAGGGVRAQPEPTVAPYERVQLDGHRIDGVFIVRTIDALGEEIDLPLSRIWLLVLMDVGSRAVLGYSLSLSENYSADDVLGCIASSVDTWTPRELPNAAMPYVKGAGLPSGVVEGCHRRVFTTLQMDNAWAHHAEQVQVSVLGMGVLEIVTNRPGSPRSDGIVERFMRTFEACSFHDMPNTTGSGPSDPRRRDPDKAAKELRIDFEDLVNITDLVLCNYNAEPHTSLSGRTPLEFLRHRLDRGRDLPRYAALTNAGGLGLFDQEHPVRIRANLAQGHRPYVNFSYARYTSDVLARRPDLNGERATLRVDRRDIRHGYLFLESGECVCRVQVEARWMSHPHDVRIRSAIGKLVKQRKLIAASTRPLADFREYLRQRAPLTRKDRNRMLQVEQTLSRSADTSSPSTDAVMSVPMSERPTTRARRRRRAPIVLETAILG